MKQFNTLREDALEEKLKASDPTGKWISDFVHSDNPKFAGKSKKERIRMALGAAYGAKRANEELELEIEEEIVAEEVEQVDELSTDLLSRYKARAGQQASAADKVGNTAKANKRFSGIVRATNKQFTNDAKVRVQ